MKILIIENDGKNNKGYFINPNKSKTPNPADSKQPIESITKEDVFDIVEYLIDNDIEFDEYQENLLPNLVQATVYESIFNNLKTITDNKKAIIDEVNNAFKDAETKYKL